MYPNSNIQGRKRQAGRQQFSGSLPRSFAYSPDALTYLSNHGATLICLYPLGHTDAKTPLKGRSFTRKPYTLQEVLDHAAAGGLVGIVPASLGYFVLDVDTGDPLAVARDLPPVMIAPSARPGRAHLYYEFEPKVHPGNNFDWQWTGANGQTAGGEVRCSNGYVAMYGGTDWNLAECHRDRRQRGRGPLKSTSSGFSKVKYAHSPPGRGYPLEGGGRKDAASGLKDDNHIARFAIGRAMAADRGGSRTVGLVTSKRRKALEDLPAPDQTPVAWRNDTLFDYVRHHAKTLEIGSDSWGVRRFYSQVRSFALAVSAQMPQPEPMAKVLATANSVSRYFVQGKAGGDYFTTRQRQFGGYNRGRNIRIANEEWDLEVWNVWLQGVSIWRLAGFGRWGSRGRIRNVLARFEEYYPQAAAGRNAMSRKELARLDLAALVERVCGPVKRAQQDAQEAVEDAVAFAGAVTATATEKLALWLSEHADAPRRAVDWTGWWGNSGRGGGREPPPG